MPIPVDLLHLRDCHIERLATRIQDVASSCKEDVCAVCNEGIALSHIALQTVEGTV